MICKKTMLLVGALALSFGACSVEDSSEEPQAPKDPVATEQSTPDSEESTLEEATAPAAEASEEIEQLKNELAQENLVSFSQLCSEPPSVSVKETISKLLDIVGSQDCDVAGQELAQQKFINLSGLGIDDISPLATLRQLKGLFLSNNDIRDITPLAELKNLEYLSIYNNKVENFAPLTQTGLRIILAGQNLSTNVPLSKNLTHAWYGINAGEPPFLAASANQEEAGELTWPAGENMCRGTWTYDQYRSCRHPSHGADQSKPIQQANGAVCGYHEKYRTCWHGDVHVVTVDDFFRFERSSKRYTEKEIRAYCQNKGHGLKPQQRIAVTDIYDVKYGRECTKFDMNNRCVNWSEVAQGFCRYHLHSKVHGPDASCGTEPDTDRPLTCVVAYEHAEAATAACGKDSRFTSRLANISDLLKNNALTNFACSTCDNLPVDSVEHIASKFDCLKLRYEALVRNFDLSMLADLEAFRAQLSGTPTDAMLEYIEVVRSLKDLFAKYPASIDEKMVDFILQVHAQAPAIGVKI